MTALSSLDVLLILMAAIGAGALNAVVGAGTLVTFPTLLALGFPPVVANVSNTVGLIPGAITGAYAYRSTLVGRAPLVRRVMVPSAIGGIVGAVLLVALPPGAFAVAVPILLLLSAVLAAVQPRVAARVLRHRLAAGTEGGAGLEETVPGWALVAIALTGVYGGYFGAAQGVILMAVLGVFMRGGMAEVNGVKNILAGVANLVSAALFVAVADVDWRVVPIVAVGATIGGGLGGRYGRRLPAGVLRPLVVTIAVVAAIWQWLR